MVITISRQFASGGHEIGQKLAEKLGFKFYDKELIYKAAEMSGISRIFSRKLTKRRQAACFIHFLSVPQALYTDSQALPSYL